MIKLNVIPRKIQDFILTNILDFAPNFEIIALPFVFWDSIEARWKSKYFFFLFFCFFREFFRWNCHAFQEKLIKRASDRG